MDFNQHFAMLLGLGEEWTVSDVMPCMGARRVDICLEYGAKSAQCPHCGKLSGVHDRQDERTWCHLDTMQFETLIHARTPHVRSPEYGVRVIELPRARASTWSAGARTG